MSENTPELSELSPEEIAKVQEMRNAVGAFMADPRHERYQTSPENKDAIEGYLERHKLDLNEESLHIAFVDLSKAGKLALYAKSKLEPVESQKEKSGEKELPPIGKATANDLGIGLADQQRARKQVEPGSGPSSHRDAFVRAAQKTSGPQRVGGGRFHL